MNLPFSHLKVTAGKISYVAKRVARRISVQSAKSIVLIGLILSAGCSVYKSAGRKNFESKAPGNIRTATGVTALATPSELNADENPNENDVTCWNQPASDPLWQIEKDTTLTVMAVGNDEIQVCLKMQ